MKARVAFEEIHAAKRDVRTRRVVDGLVVLLGQGFDVGVGESRHAARRQLEQMRPYVVRRAVEEFVRVDVQ